MMKNKKSAKLSAVLSLALACATSPAVLHAQEESSELMKPRPAESAPRAPYELLLDVSPRGDEGYVAVGARGHILLSPDGMHWEQVPSPVRANLNAVEFVDADHGWAVGHAATILATTDGGQTWNIQKFDPEMETPFLDLVFLDKDYGMAVGAYDLFYVTEDGGKTWEEYPEPLSVGEWHLNSITQLGNGDLVIAGETGLMSRSRDKGKTWELIEGPYSGTYFGVKPLGENGVILYGLRGNAFVSEDISNINVLPADTDLGYQFKKPPTMSDDDDEEESADAGELDSGPDEASQEAAEAVVAESAEAKKEALAEAERKAAEEKAAATSWQVVDNAPSVISLLGATNTRDGGYVIVGINGVIWASDNKDAKVEKLPNSREGGITAVTETPEGNLVMVGESGAFLYKRR